MRLTSAASRERETEMSFSSYKMTGFEVEEGDECFRYSADMTIRCVGGEAFLWESERSPVCIYDLDGFLVEEGSDDYRRAYDYIIKHIDENNGDVVDAHRNRFGDC